MYTIRETKKMSKHGRRIQYKMTKNDKSKTETKAPIGQADRGWGKGRGNMPQEIISDGLDHHYLSGAKTKG